MPLLQPGDKVGFKPVSLREYEDLLAQAADGRLDIASTGEIREAAA
jgi:hypothetical protein